LQPLSEPVEDRVAGADMAGGTDAAAVGLGSADTGAL